MDMLGIMWSAKPRGALIVNGKQVNNKMITRLTNAPEIEINKLITELEEHNVFSRLENGTIINRRMYYKALKEKEIAEKRAEAGKKGMEKRWGKGDNKDITQVDNKKITKITASLPSSSPTPTPTSEKQEKKETTKVVSPCPKSEPSDVDIRLVQLLIDLMQKNSPKVKIPQSLDKWTDACRLMRERDGRTEQEIEAMVQFSQKDQFWRSNILSMTKLREKFDQLWLKAKKTKFSGIQEWLREMEVKNEQ